jgi:hypothetical protein
VDVIGALAGGRSELDFDNHHLAFFFASRVSFDGQFVNESPRPCNGQSISVDAEELASGVRSRFLARSDPQVFQDLTTQCGSVHVPKEFSSPGVVVVPPLVIDVV